ISVWSVIRDTSKRLCFIASIARSNSTLSGCFDPTLASGFTDFLFVHATVKASSNARSTTIEFRLIEDLKPFHHGGTETRRKNKKRFFSVSPCLRGGFSLDP